MSELSKGKDPSWARSYFSASCIHQWLLLPHCEFNKSFLFGFKNLFFFFFYKFLFKGALPWSGTVKLHLALAAVVFGFPAVCVWDQSWCHKSFRAACHFWLVNLLMNPWFPADESEEEWSSVLLTVSLRTSPVRNCILKGFWHSQSCLQNS